MAISRYHQWDDCSSPDAQVRQLLGRPGEVWGAESSQDKLVVVYTK